MDCGHHSFRTISLRVFFLQININREAVEGVLTHAETDWRCVAVVNQWVIIITVIYFSKQKSLYGRSRVNQPSRNP